MTSRIGQVIDGKLRPRDYLMSIREHLPPQARKDLQEVGWTVDEGARVGEDRAPGRAALR